MKEKFRGYASFARSWLEEFPFNSSGKLATLWFDEIIFQIDNINGATNIVAQWEDWDSKTLRKLNRLWIPITKYQPRYKFSIDYIEKRFIAEHPDLEKTAFRIAHEETKKFVEKEKHKPKSPQDYYAFAREVSYAYLGLLEGVNSWMSLNKTFPCVFLPLYRENLVIQDLFSIATRKTPYDLFSEVINSRLPDLNNLTWDEIVDLRNNSCFNNFREKMIDLHKMVHSGDINSVKESVDKLQFSEMKELILELRPSPHKSLIKAIISKIPMGLPINPISPLLDANKIIKEKKILKKYGWIYFLIEIEKI